MKNKLHDFFYHASFFESRMFGEVCPIAMISLRRPPFEQSDNRRNMKVCRQYLPLAAFAVFYQFVDLDKLITDVENADFTGWHGSINDLPPLLYSINLLTSTNCSPMSKMMFLFHDF